MTTGQTAVDKTNLRNSILKDTNIVRSTFTTTLFSHISACLNDSNLNVAFQRDFSSGLEADTVA
jgi:hypothetical protein